MLVVDLPVPRCVRVRVPLYFLFYCILCVCMLADKTHALLRVALAFITQHACVMLYVCMDASASHDCAYVDMRPCLHCTVRAYIYARMSVRLQISVDAHFHSLVQ